MPNPLIVAQNSGSYIYRIGRIGLDSGTKDAQDTAGAGGFAYTATIRTDPQSPLGEGGLARFRRIVLRVLRQGNFTATLKVYVDDVQTQRWDNTVSPSVKVDQTVQFVFTDSAELEETILEAAIDAVGTHIALELTAVSTDLSGGLFLLEGGEVHALDLARARTDESAETQ
jgi:hypothetical protein